MQVKREVSRSAAGLAATLALCLTRAPQSPGASNGQPVALSDLDSLRALGGGGLQRLRKRRPLSGDPHSIVCSPVPPGVGGRITRSATARATARLMAF
jgi:hypothetical protein